MLIELLKIYAECASAAAINLMKNWIIIPASLAAFFLFTVILTVLGQANTGLVGGIIAGLIQVALLTLYYSWIYETGQRQRLKIKDLYAFDPALFSSIINVGFIFFIVQLLVQTLIESTTSFPVMAVVALAITIVFNPVAEVIQDRRGVGTTSLQEAYNFTLENWIEWFGPFVLMLLPWILISPSGPLTALSQTNPLLPAAPLIWGSRLVGTYLAGYGSAIPATLIGVILANWFMVFRSLLYRQLSTSSRRKRAYQRRNS